MHVCVPQRNFSLILWFSFSSSSLFALSPDNNNIIPKEQALTPWCTSGFWIYSHHELAALRHEQLWQGCGYWLQGQRQKREELHTDHIRANKRHMRKRKQFITENQDFRNVLHRRSPNSAYQDTSRPQRRVVKAGEGRPRNSRLLSSKRRWNHELQTLIPETLNHVNVVEILIERHSTPAEQIWTIFQSGTRFKP